MRVTAIFPDATIYVDGVARRVEMPPHDDNWRAIQWDGERGDVEVIIGAGVSFDDPADSGPFSLLCRHGSLTSAEMYVPFVAGMRS